MFEKNNTDKNAVKCGEIFTLIATAVVILIGVTTFIATTFLSKNNKKLTYQSKAREPQSCNSACVTCYPGDDVYSDPNECGEPTEPPAAQPTSAPEQQPTSPPAQETQPPPHPPGDSCNCVNGFYQGSGCGGGQINEPCSSSANLSCFDQCLRQGGGVEACNKECNKLEESGQLNTPTPGAGGNVCGKIGESPNDLYGCCPGLVEDPDAGYCRPSVAVGKATPTPKPFWMLPNTTPIIYSGFPTPTLTADEQRWGAYGEYCKKNPSALVCGGPTPTKALSAGTYDDFYKCLDQFPPDSPNRGAICSEFLTPAAQRSPTPSPAFQGLGCKIGTCCNGGSVCGQREQYVNSCIPCGGDKSCINGSCDFNIGRADQTNTTRFENGECYAYLPANQVGSNPYRVNVNNSLCTQGVTVKVDPRTIVSNLKNPENGFELRMINGGTTLVSDKADPLLKANLVVSAPIDGISTGIDWIKWKGRQGLGHLTNDLLGDKNAPFEDSYAKMLAADSKVEEEAKRLGKDLNPCIWGCVNNTPRMVGTSVASIVNVIPFVGPLFTGKENGIGDGIIDTLYAGESPQIIAQQKTFAGGVAANMATGMIIGGGAELGATKHAPGALNKTASGLDRLAEAFDPLGTGTSRAVTTLTRMSDAFETAAKGVKFVDDAAKVVSPSHWIRQVSPEVDSFMMGTAFGRLLKYSMDKPVKQDINKKVQGK